MGVVQHLKYKNLPFVVDRIYKTKFQTGEIVLLKEIRTNNKGEIIGLGVIYDNTKHLGICPLSVDRLIPDQVLDCEITVCDNCGEII